MDKLKKLLKIEYVPLIIFSIFIFLLNKCYMAQDDIVYKDIYNNLGSFFNWVTDFYQVWSGRIGIFVITHFFLNQDLILFKIANTLIFDIIVIATCYLRKEITGHTFSSKQKFIFFTIVCSLILIIDFAVLSSGAFWVTGAFNYLWPFAFMLISIIPFIWLWNNKTKNSKYYILFILSNFVCCFSEQCSAVLLVFGILSIIYALINKHKINKLLILHFIIIAVITVFSLVAPGNQARLNSETIKWYPSFEMLSMQDKLLQGYIILVNHLINNSKIIMLVLTGLLFYNYLRNDNSRKIEKVIASIPFSYMLLSVIPFNSIFVRIYPNIDIDGFLNEWLFTFIKYDVNYLYEVKCYLSIIIATIIFLLISVLILHSFKNIISGIINCLLYFAALASAMSISISPTVYASGNRIFLVTDFLLILILGTLIPKDVSNKKKHIEIITITILVFLAIILTINNIIEVNGILY